MKIDPLVLESIKRMHLPTIIERYGIPLQKNGWFNRKSSCKIACPFHEDKTPSLSVSEKNGKWVWNCFGCREHGNTFDFLMKMDKSDFEGTYRKYADVREINTVPSTPIPTPPLPPPTDPHINNENENLPTVNRADLLAKVAERYHQAFLEDRMGADYLEGRGIKDPAVYTTFKIGLANGSLRDILPKDPAHELIVSLKTLGVLNEKGNEHFTNCVVFPIYDERGAVAGLYGRRISSNASKSAQTPSAPGLPDHLYLPGPRRGIWNGGAAKVYKDLVVTESIIDALSLYSVGIKNVVPLYGTNGLTEGHSALFLEQQTRRVKLCLDNDAAGDRARPGVKEKLESLGIEVLDYDLPKTFKDPNEALLKGFPGEELVALARITKVPSEEEKTKNLLVSDGKSGDAQQAWPTIERKEEAVFLRFPSRLYRVRGLSAKNLDQLRVNIKVESCGEGHEGPSGYHLDSLDLYSAKSRATFVACVRKVIEANEGDLLKELNQIIEALESIQVDTVEGKKEEETPMTTKESEEAMAVLRRPTLLPEILQDLDAIGYVGEEKNKAIGYLVGVSRKLLDPLSCVIISQSAAGKSVLADIIERVTPPEDVKLYSRVTANGLFYFKRDELKRKLLILEERAGAESADYSIRTLQSKKKLVQAVPVKNPDTGKIQTVTFEVEGPIAYIETTTKSRIHDENATRCFEIYLDESKEQTQRIHSRQRQSKTLSGLNKKGGQDTLLRRHHNMQRLLRTIAVVIPYAELLEFPAEWLRTRRDNLRFLNLIEVIAFLHQHQRAVQKTADGSEYIEATLDDYKTAYSLAREVMGESFLELKKPQRNLLDQIATLLSEKGDEVTRREIRDHTGLTDFRLRDLLGELVSLEYIVETVSGQGRTCRYRLADRSVRPEKIVVGLTAPDALAEKIKQNGLLP